LNYYQALLESLAMETAEYPAGTHIRVKVIVVDMARIGTVWQLRLSDQEQSYRRILVTEGIRRQRLELAI
jgi:hypothetical protein